MPDDEDDDFEYVARFVGPCTCDHEPEEHSWGSCGAGSDPSNPYDEGCPCEAGWEE